MDRSLKHGTRRSRTVGRTIAAAVGLSMTVMLLDCDAPPQSRSQVLPETAIWSNVQYDGSLGGDPVHGERIARTVCAACHGADGNSPDPGIPKLAGQKLPYLYWELRAFKQDIRKSDVMTPNLAALSYAELADVANFYSQQSRSLDTVANPDLAASGERRFFGGMPSCAMCHNASAGQRMPMMGMMASGRSDAPNLNDQHANYIVTQLNRFASGERRGTVMNSVAATLSGPDKIALAEFLAGSP